MLFLIDHLTTYQYSRPVFLEPHTFHLVPRNDGAQKLISSAVKIEPQPAGLSRYLDVEGNICIFAWFTGLTDYLKIQSISKTENRRINPFDYILPADVDPTLPLKYPEHVKFLLHPCLKITSANASIKELADSIITESDKNLSTFLNNLNSHIYNNFQILVREEGEPWTPEQTLKMKSGACRDLTLLFMECCKYAGIASRFVSGYQQGDPDNPERYLHAWPEVYIPGAGWRGYDPIHGLGVADQHIALAASAFSHMAAPLSGTFRGTDARQYMSTKLTIQVSNLEPE